MLLYKIPNPSILVCKFPLTLKCKKKKSIISERSVYFLRNWVYAVTLGHPRPQETLIIISTSSFSNEMFWDIHKSHQKYLPNLPFLLPVLLTVIAASHCYLCLEACMDPHCQLVVVIQWIPFHFHMLTADIFPSIHPIILVCRTHQCFAKSLRIHLIVTNMASEVTLEYLISSLNPSLTISSFI